MKKILCLILALCVVFSLAACSQTGSKETEAKPEDKPSVEPDQSYTIRIYSNSNSTDRVEWFVKKAEEANNIASVCG